MGFFDHYYKGEVSAVGLMINEKQNHFIFSTLKGLLPASRVKLLEIGTGKGSFARICRESGIHYIGIEPNEKQVEELGKQGLDVRCCYAPPLPFPDQHFDVIYCANVLEHMNGLPMAEDMIHEIRDKLVADGLAVIVCPNYLDWGKEFYNCDYTHNFVTTPRRMTQLIANNGFQVVGQYMFAGFLFDKKRFILKFLNKICPWKLLDLLLGRFLHADFFYKAKLTFSECFLIIAKKAEAERS